MSELSIKIAQLSPESRKYLTEQDGLSENITFQFLAAKVNSQEILTNLVTHEDNFRKVCEKELKQAQTSLKKRKAWTIGVTLSSLVLLTAAILLILFFPPAAAIILPAFAAIGSWSPLLLLTAFLPSLGLSIASLIKVGHCKSLQKALEKNQTLLGQLNKTRDELLGEETTMPSTLTRPSNIFTSSPQEASPMSKAKENNENSKQDLNRTPSCPNLSSS